MNKFKVGDVVVRICGSHEGMEKGDKAIVKTIVEEEQVELDGFGGVHWTPRLDLLEDRSKWHQHHDVICAWAKGVDIQYRSIHAYPYKNWNDLDKDRPWATPAFNDPFLNWRIKPKQDSEITQIENEMRDLAKKQEELADRLKEFEK